MVNEENSLSDTLVLVRNVGCSVATVVMDGLVVSMKTPREVKDFPLKGNHIGDRIRLPSGQVYRWIEFKRWQREYNP